MKRSDAIELYNALLTKGLLVKHLSTGSYASLIEFKRPLKRYIDEMGEDEKSLAEEMGVEPVENRWPLNNKDFAEKFKVIQSKEFTPKVLNFIPADEFKKWTDEIDFGPASILADFLLKA